MPNTQSTSNGSTTAIVPTPFEGDPQRSGGLATALDAPLSTGLVNCAKTQPDLPAVPDDARGAHQAHFKFPSAWAVHAAASAFPQPAGTGRGKRIHNQALGLATREGLRPNDRDDFRAGHYWAYPRDIAQPLETNESAEGPYATLEIAPGLVRLRRTDPAKKERALERIRQLELTEREQGTGLRDFNYGVVLGPRTEEDQKLYEAAVAKAAAAKKGLVNDWSRRSQTRLRSTIAELNLHAMLTGERAGMTTLSVPGPWGAIMPDAATASKIFNRFQVAYRKVWGTPVWIWKREFQRRGAPHWHLWHVPPTHVTYEARRRFEKNEVPIPDYRTWLRSAWARAMGLDFVRVHVMADGSTWEQDGALAFEYKPGEEWEGCVCRDENGERPLWCRSMWVGTNVDFRSGDRASDPNRLGHYFLKESAGVSGKEYQNSVGWAWCVGGVDRSIGEHGPQPRVKIPRASVGRFWGRSAGLEKVLASVPLHPHMEHEIETHLQRARWGKRLAWKNTTHGVVVRTGISGGTKKPTRVVREIPTNVDWSNGLDGIHSSKAVYIRRRPVARVVKPRKGAGWVGVNDGPAFALQIARSLTGEPNRVRPDVAPPVPGSRRDQLMQKYSQGVVV